jgi:hypothetical protein
VFKHTLAILLLGIMLFNWCGYKFFIAAIENRETNKLEARIDENNYDESSLISIKIPCTALPYYSNSKSFEPTEGRIEIAAVEYNYVKRRIYNDSLELLVIPNQAAMHLHSAKDAFFRLVNDLQSAQTKKTNSHNEKSKSFSLDNYILDNLFALNSVYLALSKDHLPYLEEISPDISSTDEHPPDSAT